ncbi:hypothetical protein CLOM_g41 [Closterium sp. NIES-68]|nr:hypothetical protein CLOM_g41 [Closterium sp. NIES-68]GJP73545.1 hypothetical protein CLOP_g4245 [Closterium sp. NIES-67]
MAASHRHRSRIVRRVTIFGERAFFRSLLLPLVALLLVTCASCLSFAMSCDEVFASRENDLTSNHGPRRRLQQDDAEIPPADDSSVEWLMEREEEDDASGGLGLGRKRHGSLLDLVRNADLGEESLGEPIERQGLSPGDAGDGAANEAGDEWSPDDGVASSHGDQAKVSKPVAKHQRQKLPFSIHSNTLRSYRLTLLHPPGTKYQPGKPKNGKKKKVLSWHICKGAGKCPDLRPCGGYQPEIDACWHEDYMGETDSLASQQDDLAYQIWRKQKNPGAETYPSTVFRARRYRLANNPLESCVANVSGKLPGELLRPGCWALEGEGAEAVMRRAKGGGAEEERAEWAGQVFVLRDVFVNHFGQVFNKTHLFDTGGCNWKAKFTYPKDAPVVAHKTVVNLMVARSDQRSYHQVLERLPLLHVLRKMTKNAALKDAHVALPSSRGLRRMLSSILDFDLPWTPFPFNTPNTLLFAESLIQPLSEHCDEPQHSVWRDIRASLFDPHHPCHPRTSSISPPTSLSLPSALQAHHLFLQSSVQAIQDAKAAQNPGSKEKLSVSYPTPFLAGVLPMLDVDLEEDEVAWAALPSDWVVVVGLQGLHNRADAEAIKNVVLQHFPAHRIASYCSSMTVDELRNLFSRTALFITVSDSTLMHSIFMRPATLVLELRHPSAQRFPSYSLSSVLRLQHYISVCSTSPSFGGEEPDVDPAMAAVAGGGAEGENSPLFCDLDHVKEVVDRAAHFVYLSEAAYVETSKRLTRRKWGGGGAATGSNLAVPMLQAATSEGVDWDLTLPDFTSFIPGSVLRTHGQVESFRSWAACVGQEGRWKFDGRPRFLPWPYKGPGTCDTRAVETMTGVIAVNDADDVVRRGGAPSEWKIRGELKYVWDVPKGTCDYKEVAGSVASGEEGYEEEGGERGGEGGEGEEGSEVIEGESGGGGEEEGFDSQRRRLSEGRRKRYKHRRTGSGNSRGNQLQQQQQESPTSNSKQPWKPFDPRRFCDRVGRDRTLVFVGDSLQHQLFQVFIDSMLMGVRKPFSSELNETREESPECSGWVLGPAQKIFCRDVTFDDSICPGLRIVFLRNDHLQLGNPREFSHFAWTRAPVLPAADAIILNRGPHYREDKDFEPHLRATLLYLRNRFPDKLIIYRNSAGGHKDCPKYHKPIETPQDPSTLPFNWDKFPHQNWISQPLAERLGMPFMDIERMMALRPDGHTGQLAKLDCLHYCMPGPLDTWVQVMANMLEKLLAPRRLRE